MKQFSKYLDGIGEVTFKRHHSAKRFILRIDPKEGVKVTLPQLASQEEAMQFVKTKKAWVQKRLSYVQEKTLYTPESNFQTRAHVLDMKPTRRKDIWIRVYQGKIEVRYPQTMDVADERLQAFVRKGINLAMRKEAENRLLPRLRELAKALQVEYRQVRLKRMKTRWGSCSAQNNINLNIYLAQLPDRLIDYVLLHELTHIVVKNHGPNFWLVLNKLTDNQAKALDKEVKRYTVQWP